MGLLFDPSEVFQIAVRIEENGERFYRELSKRLDDPEVAELFAFLADEEVTHRKFYGGLLADMEPYEPEESYPGEYFDYLKAYANGMVFNQEHFENNLKEMTDAASALTFAIGVEWDSIHLYQELKGLVPPAKVDRLDRVIDEERKHFVKLSRLKKEKNY